MLRKLIRFIVSILLILIVVFFFIVGKITDMVYNKVEEIPEIQLSQETKDLHSNILMADLHADNLLWDRDPLDRLNHGAVDIPRLIEGGYALQVFDAVIKTPKNQNYTSNTGDTDNIQLLAMANRWPIPAWFNLTERALHQSKILHEAANESPNLEIIKSKEDLRYFLSLRKSNSYKVGGILSIEGLHALENEFANLQVLYDAGYRMMGLVHFFDNEVGGSSAGVDQGGLTDFGRRIVKEMERKQIIIDLAHASPALIADVLETATRPVVVSHTGVAGVRDSPRNLTDQQIKAIADNGGLIGIGFWEEAVGGIHPTNIAAAIRYTVDIAGIDHVALGSDFDGAVTTGFDSSKIIYLTQSLIEEGFTDQEIEKIMGKNQIDFFMNNLP